MVAAYYYSLSRYDRYCATFLVKNLLSDLNIIPIIVSQSKLPGESVSLQLRKRHIIQKTLMEKLYHVNVFVLFCSKSVTKCF